MVNGEKKWRGKFKKAGYTDPQEEKWIKKSFYKKYRDYYDKLISDENIGKIQPLPSGQRMQKSVGDSIEFGDRDDNNDIPLQHRTNVRVQYVFGDREVCAFGNMANAMNLMGDDKAANFFFFNRFKSIETLLQEHPDIKINTNGNKFTCALLIAR